VIRRRICSAAELSEGGIGLRFEVARGGQPAPAFAIRFRGRVNAFVNRCGHLPVELDWEQGRFFDHSGLYLICATHGALYDPETGRCLGGRCNGKGLEAVEVVEDDGQVFLVEEEGGAGTHG